MREAEQALGDRRELLGALAVERDEHAPLAGGDALRVRNLTERGVGDVLASDLDRAEQELGGGAVREDPGSVISGSAVGARLAPTGVAPVTRNRRCRTRLAAPA